MELGWHSVENDCLPPLWHRFNFGPVSWVHQVVVGFSLTLGVFLWVPILLKCQTAVYLFLECFFTSGVKFFTFCNRNMRTFDLLIVKGDTLRLLIVKCVSYD